MTRDAAPFWRYLGAAVAVAVGLVVLADRLPAPAAASAPPGEFSEARAQATVEMLSRRIGHRVTGSDGQRAAADYLRGQLAAIPGIEVASQSVQVVDDPDHLGMVFDAPVTNVLARLPGEHGDAIVISAHYDSPPESVGAADNAVAVAASLELARALAAGPRLAVTVIFNFNDGEEIASLGSDGFLSHPWRRAARAFINLDAAGATGRALLFQTGKGSRALVRAFAAAPRPLGTVVAQDIFQSGVVPSSTDFGVYAERGALPGLDVALYRDGYAYHTDRDVPERIAPGTLQHLGDNLLGALRALDRDGLALDAAAADEPPPVYFDLLGRWMLVIPAGLAGWLPWLFAAIGLCAGGVAARRRGLATRRVVAAFAIVAAAAIAALVSAAVVALVLGGLIGRPHGWYAHPELAATYAAIALVVFAAAIRRACPRLVGAAELAIGALGLWLALLVAAALAGAGSAYIAIAWVIALSVTVLLDERWPAVRFVVWTLALIVLAEPALIVLQVFLPIGGRLAIPPSFDPVVAVLVAFPAVLAAAAFAAPLASAAVPRAARRAIGAAIATGLLLLAALPPFSTARPQRLFIEYACGNASCDWQVDSEDALGAARALSAARPIAAWPAPRPPAPRVTVTPDASTPGAVWLDIEPGDARDVTLALPAAALRAWSEPAPIPHVEDGERVRLRRVAPRQPWRVRLSLSPGAPRTVQIMHRWPVSPEVNGILHSALPDWTAIDASVSRTTNLEL